MIETPIAASNRSTAIRKTGGWRYAKPVFLERIAPCNEACPAGEDIDTIMALNSQKRFIEAYQKITDENPLPGTCGRVCTHPCEGACNRNFLDEAVSIRGLERFVSDWARERDFAPKVPPKGNDEKVGIVGSGPAGLSCAYFLAQLGYRVTIFEREARPGGMLRCAIPEYRLPTHVLDWEVEQIFSLGIDLQTNTFVGRDLPIKDLQDFDAMFFAPGASQSQGIPGVPETCQGVEMALEFLRKARGGNPPAMTGRVLVVGGGNTAIDAARVALRLGGQPTVIYRRSPEEMPAIQDEVVQAGKEGVEFLFETGVTGVIDKWGRVEAVSCLKMKVGKRDRTGRRSFHPSASPPFQVNAERVILAVGQSPELSFLPPRIQLNSGFIAVDDFLETTMKKTFAGGDAVDQPRTVVHAIASGKRGALAIDLLIQKKPKVLINQVMVGSKGALSAEVYRHGLTGPQSRSMAEVVSYETLNLHYFMRSPMIRPPVLSPNQAVQGFQEIEGAYRKNQAVRSARRCFNCGICTFCFNCYQFCPDLAVRLDDRTHHREIDYDHCKGCGICVEECPRAAMSWARE